MLRFCLIYASSEQDDSKLSFKEKLLESPKYSFLRENKGDSRVSRKSFQILLNNGEDITTHVYDCIGHVILGMWERCTAGIMPNYEYICEVAPCREYISYISLNSTSQANSWGEKLLKYEKNKKEYLHCVQNCDKMAKYCFRVDNVRLANSWLGRHWEKLINDSLKRFENETANTILPKQNQDFSSS